MAPNSSSSASAPRHTGSIPALVVLVSHSLLERSRVFRESWERHGQPRHDSRVKGAVVLAPAPPIRGLTTESLAAIRAPVAIAVGGADTEAPPDPCAKWLYNQLADSRLYELGPTVGHYAFLCEATEFGRACEPDICRDAPGVGRRVVHDRIARVALDLAGRGEAPGVKS